MKWKIGILFIVFLTQLGQAQEIEILKLDQCIQLALENNPSVQQSQLSHEQAQIATRQSYANLYPTAGLSAGTSTSDANQTGSDWQSQWNIQGSVEQSLYRPGLYSGIRQAKVSEKISEISNADLKTQIRLTVENFYYQILTGYALIGVYNENIQTAAENLEKIRTMHKVGARTESDVLKAEVQKGNFEALKISEQERLQSYRRSLNITMGRSPEIYFEVAPLPADLAVLPAEETAKNILLENNREYQMLQQNNKSREIAVKIAKEAYLPSLSGYYSYAKSGRWEDNSPQSSNQVGLRASIDLFDGFNKQRMVQTEKLSLEQAQIELTAKKRDLTAQLTNLYTSLQTYNSLIAIDEKNVESSKRDLELVTARYVVGASTTLDQMNAQASLLQSQSNLVKDKYSQKIVEAQIRQLLGY